MRFPKASVLLWLIVSLGTAQTIQISGVVKDSATGLPIPGAEARLRKARLIDTTDTGGSFTLSGEIPSAANHARAAAVAASIIVANGSVQFSLPQPGRVAVNAYSVQGKLLHSVRGEWQAGTHTIALPHPAPGVHLYRISLGNGRHTLTQIGMAGHSRFTPIQTGPGRETSLLAKRAAALEDTIVVSAMGYYPQRLVVDEFVISGIEIRCSKHVINYSDDVTDIDGNVYRTVVIGAQTWMAENLKTTRLNDGTAIPLVPDSAEWTQLGTPGYCWYSNDEAANKDTYGALYNWFAVGTEKLAPTGWHVATDAEWTELAEFLGLYAGGKLKQAGLTHWDPPNGFATNEVGFSALPAGMRDSDASYSRLGNDANFWSSTFDESSSSAAGYSVDNMSPLVDRFIGGWKSGFSVRCIRD